MIVVDDNLISKMKKNYQKNCDKLIYKQKLVRPKFIWPVDKRAVINFIQSNGMDNVTVDEEFMKEHFGEWTVEPEIIQVDKNRFELVPNIRSV